MLYETESLSIYRRENLFIWFAMAFQAGVLNIGGFLACHRFVSHITGFATYFGVEITQSNSQHAWGMLIVPLFFLVGSMISGVLVDLRLKQQKKPKYYISFGIIFFLILLIYAGGVFELFGRFGEPINDIRDYILLALLCLVCGIQNGTVTTVSKSIVRTTHLTGVATDLGIGIIRILNRRSLKEALPDEGHANTMRVGIILFFLLGSVTGGVVFPRLQYLGFVIPAITSGVLFGSMIYFRISQGWRKVV
jgi:uncharacterized membrane protein YoaK (UPF0700 family)